MRTLALAVGILFIGWAVGTCAQAENYPWCAYFTNGITNCGFENLEQCLSEIKGKTGLCDHNHQYVGSSSPEPVSINPRHYLEQSGAQ